MRTFRNHTIVNAAIAGNSIRVAGQTMRSLPVNPVCLLGRTVQLRQRDQARQPNCAGKRYETSPRWAISHRSSEQGRTSGLSLAGSGLYVAS